MCGGFSYSYKDPAFGAVKPRKVYFPIPHAVIPVINEQEIQMVQWGRRKGEDEEYHVPATGWARLDSLDKGKWEEYEPTRVLIPALTFMEKDQARVSHWFTMEPETYLLGIDIKAKKDKDFIYIVTNPAEGPFKEIHDRWPAIVREDFSLAPFESVSHEL